MPETVDAATAGIPVTLGEVPSRASTTHARLVALVEAVDAYTSHGGSWDDVLYQTELAKALLGLDGG